MKNFVVIHIKFLYNFCSRGRQQIPIFIGTPCKQLPHSKVHWMRVLRKVKYIIENSCTKIYSDILQIFALSIIMNCSSTRPIQILITNIQILPESLTLNGWFKFETAVGIVQRHSLNSLNAVSEHETFV